MNPQEIYGVSLQLFEKARELSGNGECDKELLEGESNKLEEAVHTFAASLDERRDLLVQACTFYCNFEMVCWTAARTVDIHTLHRINAQMNALMKRTPFAAPNTIFV